MAADAPAGALMTVVYSIAPRRDRFSTIWAMLELKASTGKTLVIVTHDESLARSADRVIRMADGHIVI